MYSINTKFTKIAPALALAAAAFTAPAQAELSGNISVVSEYVLRGMTINTESDTAAVQGGFDYAHESGFYAGYWGSSLDYGDEAASGFENDFYAGYGGALGGFSYDLGLIYYVYTSIDDADAPELAASVGYGPFSLGFKYLMDDVVWGNEGDTYWTLGYETALPKDFAFAATAGFYTYEEEGEFITATEEDSGFRHLDLTLSHPISDTGADMFLTYIVGGEDRDGLDQEDAVVLGLSYGFGI